MADDPATAKGFVAGQVYQFGDLANINLYNGNLNIALPLGPSYPGGGHLTYSLTLAYSGNNWLQEQNYRYLCGQNGDPNYCAYYWVTSYTTSRRFNAGLGWLVSLGGLLPRGDTLDETAQGIQSSYRSADGADHRFITTTTSNANTGPFYSTERTQRMTFACNDACRELAFPDGTIRRFNESDGQLTQIRDRFNNQVNIAYSSDASGAPIWTITDTTGTRSHTVTFIKLLPGGTQTLETDPTAFYVVKQVNVAKFGGGSASYVFHYNPADDGIDKTTLISRRGPNSDPTVANTLWVPLLRGITLPDGTSYSFETSIGSPNCIPPAVDGTGRTGHLTGVTLPTGGRYAWEYQIYALSFFQSPPPPGPVGGDLGDPPLIEPTSVGLKKQMTYDRGNIKLSERVYDTALLYGSGGPATAKVLKNTLTTMMPDPNNAASNWMMSSKVENFFGVGDPSISGSPPVEAGLPYTIQAQPDPNSASDVLNPLVTDNITRYLTSKTYDTNNKLVSARYVVYEHDPASGDPPDYYPNLRVQSEQTVTNPTPTGGYLNSSTTDNSEYDGYGHYRTSKTNGSPGQTIRTTTTAFNRSDSAVTSPGAGDPGIFDTGTYGTSTFHEWPLDRAWILNLYTSVTASEGGSARKTLTSFDPATGALQRTRTLNDTSATPVRGTKDLIATFTTDGAGNLTKEEYFGGDSSTQNTALPLADVTPADRTYVLSHSYSAGTLAKTSYLSPACTQNCASLLDIVDRTNDPSTGLPNATKDVSQLTTMYDYDNMGRIGKVTPLDALWPTTYHYPISASSATVTATTQPDTNADSTKALTSTFTYDGLGRLTTEATTGAGTTRYRVTTYDSSGRKSKVSTLDTAAAPTHFTTFTYDALDRLLSMTEPDGSNTTFDYSEAWTTKRTASIHTTSSGDIQATTKEKHDRQNRLVEVDEPNGTVTSYAYDVADHLTSVTTAGQHRYFTYDGRGFLRTETHPELGINGNGVITYGDYDARGHAHSKRTGAAGGIYDLSLTYDDAERLTNIAEPNHTLKTFIFGSGNDTNPADYHNGKLVTAIRFNRMPDVSGDIKVTETYKYTDTSGRPKERDTKIENGNTVVQSFQELFSYDSLGAVIAPGYPTCLSPVNCAVPAAPAPFTYTNGLLTDVPGFASLTYNNNGTLSTVSHANSVSDSIAQDDNGMPRPKSIDYTGWTNCTPPATPSITAANSVSCNSVGNVASITSPVQGVTYAWSITGQGASIDSPTTGPSITYNSGFGALVTLTVTASSSTSCTATANRSVALATVSISQQPASITITSGSSTQLSLIVNGSNPHYQWYQGTPPSGAVLPGQTSSTFTTPSLTQTTTYWVHVTSDCGSIDSNAATVSIATIPAPAGLTATTQTPATSVLIHWIAVPSASSYIVEYATNVAGPFTQLGQFTSAPAMHALPVSSPLVAYVYRVWSADVNGVRSAVSNMDYAITGTTIFTDEPIQKRVTRIKGAHTKELRDAIDAVRAAASTSQHPLPPIWGNGPPPSGVIRASDLTTLFGPLNAARSVFGLSAFGYTQGVAIPASGGWIVSEHIQQLRDSLR